MKRFVQRVEWVFRHVIVYPFFRVLLQNKAHEGAISLESIHSILILRFDKIGDMIVTKPIFRILKNRNPHLSIGVVTSPANAEIISLDTHVDDRYILYSNPFKLLGQLLKARKAHYDVVLNFIFNRTTSAGLLANFVSPHGVKVGQGAEKYSFYFNKMHDLRRSQSHMLEILADYTSEVFEIQIRPEELGLAYEISDESKRVTEEFLTGRLILNGAEKPRYAVLNISAGEPVNRISWKQMVDIGKYLVEEKLLNLVVIFAPENRETAVNVTMSINSTRCCMFPSKGKAPLVQIAALLERASFVITPDTSIVHLASAVKTPVLALFSPILVNQEWLPFRVQHQTIVAETGMTVSSIPVDLIKKRIDEFVSKVDTNYESKLP